MGEALRDDIIADKRVYNLVWPIVADKLNIRGNLRKIPWGDDSDTKEGLDYECQGITMSMRVQEGFYYETFTIRLLRPSGIPTEINKMLRGDIKTEWTIQVYIINGDLFRIGMIRTVDLKDYIKKYGPDEFNKALQNTNQWQCFGIVNWGNVENKMNIWQKDEGWIKETPNG